MSARMQAERRRAPRGPVEAPAGALDAEPWVLLSDGADLADWGHDQEVAYNQANRQSEKYRFYVRTFDFLCENRIRGDYHEFGCHRARTFRMALTEARRHNLHDMRFVAFDSFAGLPPATSAPSQEQWREGALATSEEEFLRLIRAHDLALDRIDVVKGLYDETLTAERQQEFSAKRESIALACIDCDLYESAVPVFAFIEPLLQEGSVLYIDDLFAGYRGSPEKGVARAFIEFQERSRWRFVRHLDVGWWGRSYIAYDGDRTGGLAL